MFSISQTGSQTISTKGMTMNRIMTMTMVVVAVMGVGYGGMNAAVGQVSSEPVGFLKVAVPAESDALLSAPFGRDVEYVGLIESVSGSTLTFANAPFTGKSFANTHFARVRGDGAKGGQWSTIVSHTNNSLTLEDATLVSGLVAGDRVAVQAHQTLDSLFPSSLAGVAFLVTTDTNNQKTQVLELNNAAVGVDKQPSKTFYYFNGAWRLNGGSSTVNVGGTVLPPEIPFILRNRNNPNTLTFWSVGNVEVREVGRRWMTSNAKNDLYVATGRPHTMTLNELMLGGDAAFVSTSQAWNRRDQVLLFDNSALGTAKSSVEAFYYIDVGGNQGWRRLGDDTGADWGDVPLLELGGGFILRKAAGTPGSADWTGLAPY
jgi:uncharacterized protein (TIGR02597 family)